MTVLKTLATGLKARLSDLQPVCVPLVVLQADCFSSALHLLSASHRLGPLFRSSLVQQRTSWIIALRMKYSHASRRQRARVSVGPLFISTNTHRREI
jgi:hypothetical protein